MVKRKKATKRRVYRRSYKRKSSGTSGGFLSKVGKPIGAAIYGAAREKISDAIARSSLGQKLPASQFTDEAVMLAAMWGARKMGAGKKGILASIIRNGESVEWSRIGATAADLYLTKQNNAVSGQSSLFDGGGY